MTKRLPATWLIGKKVRLRPLEVDDVPLLRRVGVPADKQSTVFIIQSNAGRDIGVVRLAFHGPQAQIGIALRDRRRWLDGTAADALRVGREGAFRSLPIVRLEALTAAHDASAVRAYLRAGFKREGVLRGVLGGVGGRQTRRDAVILSALADD